MLTGCHFNSYTAFDKMEANEFLDLSMSVLKRMSSGHVHDVGQFAATIARQ